LITVATHDIAESLAHLIDGYQIMYNQGSSVFKKKGLERCESADLRVAVAHRPQNSSYGVNNDARIKREHVTLKELIGGGQFGNVYRGTLADPVRLVVNYDPRRFIEALQLISIDNPHDSMGAATLFKPS
uniref:Protein kinase domain-containing protein n=1 Tax=Haemonchus placei TaxID=6290 RepID=A0A0N4W010_HAEPC